MEQQQGKVTLAQGLAAMELEKAGALKDTRESRRAREAVERRAIKQMRRIHLEDGDVLAVYVEEQPSRDFLRSLQALVNGFEKKNISCLILPAGVDLERLDPKMMAKYGWVRKRKSALILPKHLQGETGEAT